MDFVSDGMAYGPRFRCLNVVDDYHFQSPNIRMFGRASAPQCGHLGISFSSRPPCLVDDGEKVIRRPGVIGTSIDALEPVDGSVAFRDASGVKTCFLELAVDVTGEHKSTALHRRRPCAKNAKIAVGRGYAIEREAVSIKSPAQARMARKASWIGDVFQRKSMLAQYRVGPPETLRPPKIRLAGIHAHASARSDYHPIRIPNPIGCLPD